MSYEPLETPNPNEFAIRVWASPMQVLSKMGALVAGTTTLAESNLATVPASEAAIGSFIYLKPLGKRDDGAMGFVFGMPKTEAEKNQPFRSEIRTENYPWEGVLLNYRSEPNFRESLEMRDPGGNPFFQQKWNTRYTLLAPVQGATSILYEWFLSPTKFTNLRRPTIQQPVHVPVGHLPGDASEPIGNVLIAKRIRVALKVLGPVALEERRYEPTIPAGRVRHVIDDDQDQIETGHYLRLRKTAIPTPSGKIIRDR
jgi:hypothetical protein